MTKKLKDPVKIAISFGIMFILYHTAEYMLLFKNSAAGFFVFQFLFFLSAWILGNWIQKNGLAFWGLSKSQLKIKPVLIGFFLGILLYGVPYVVSISLGIEIISKIPNSANVLKASIPFAFGVLFSSFSEDILTRGAVYKMFKNKLSTRWIILLSALVYVLNHIYRLGDGWETLSYLFLLGVLFIIPFMCTKSLWITGFMHWSGNTIFYVTHNVIETTGGLEGITPNQIFIMWLLLLTPMVWYVFTRFKGKFE